MSQDSGEYWIDDSAITLLMETRRRRGEQTIVGFEVEEDGCLIVVSCDERNTKSHTVIPPGHWWDHTPTDEELAIDPGEDSAGEKNG